MPKDTTKWYAEWFNTPYYHSLYKNRDDSEAKKFMDNLTQHLSLQTDETILDLACGKGRHSRYLNSLGYQVTGVDLSKNSIDFAKQHENERLEFAVHDMTQVYPQQFNVIFNLFTSFGYFEKEEDNLNTIKAIKSNLKTNGIGVIDFMNVNYVIDNLVPSETKTIEGVTYTISRFVENGFINKEINFIDQGDVFTFTERVKAIKLDEFKAYFETAGLTLLEIYGDYNLTKFNTASSPRLIMIFQ
ncbi:class I SAM-dependent methyltransferase [Aquimarina agarilytica]|uniref:class I SAM-dependent methyltransferase n=1 Tax=Aquimarina agarilytica TaxID=1087449 RepID=UPI000289918E|nr:class I SAM-dependent methyltransferase [Aquimarina agarilytica]